jgi:PhnB protein
MPKGFSMSLNPYLSFNGNAEQALELYKSTLGGEAYVMRFGDVAEMANHFGPDMKEKIMHARLQSPLGTIMLSDAPPGHLETSGNNVQVAVQVDSGDQAERIFSKLSDGGDVTMPLGKTFFAEKFGMCTDKFGVRWMVNYAPNGQ